MWVGIIKIRSRLASLFIFSLRRWRLVEEGFEDFAADRPENACQLQGAQHGNHQC